MPALRVVLGHGATLAAAAFVLQWLQHHYGLPGRDADFYGLSIAVVFISLGLWLGLRVTARQPCTALTPSVRDTARLGLSGRERQVLNLLVAGSTNKEIARELNISPNTVKTHLAGLYAKLEVSRRTQAASKARELQIL